MTYGGYEESACHHLRTLLLLGPTNDEPIIEVCRREALNAVAERLQHVAGRGLGQSAGRRGRSLSSIVASPVRTLADLAREMGSGFGVARAPSDVLRSDTGTQPQVGHWASAARDLFLATSELTRAPEQPWITQRAAGWHVVADAADVLEAIVALDLKGLRHAGPDPHAAVKLTERLLTAADVGRVARLFGTDDVADWGEAGVVTSPHTVALVRTAADLWAAQRQLATSLTPIGHDPFLNRSDARPGLRCARVLAAGQAQLNSSLAEEALRHSDATLSTSFQTRVLRFRELHAATVRLVDIEPRRPTLPVLQQTEISTQLRALRNLRLDHQQLERLNAVSGRVARNLGQALRREGMQRGTIRTLRLCADGVSVPAAVANTREPFHAACRALADEPADHPRPRTATGERTRLRQALDDLSYPSRRSPQIGVRQPAP